MLFLLNQQQKQIFDTLVRSKMDRLKMNSDTYNITPENDFIEKLSYVLINPPSNFELNVKDIVYLLKPGTLQKD